MTLWADLKDALANLAASGSDMTSLRVSFAPTIDSFSEPSEMQGTAPTGDAQVAPEGNLPGGPMEPEKLAGEAAQA